MLQSASRLSCIAAEPKSMSKLVARSIIPIQRAKQASEESQTLASFAHGFARITNDDILLTSYSTLWFSRSFIYWFADFHGWMLILSEKNEKNKILL